MFGLGAPELLIILVLVLVLFGAAKIPALAKSLGKGVSEFRKARMDGLGGLDEESAAAKGLTCPSCHQQIGQDAHFCTRCGRSLKAARSICGQCRTALKPQNIYCPKCGRQVSGEHGPA